jgi:kynurenine formamidase
MIIDLSVALNQDTPAYPGDPKISITQSATYASDGCLGHAVQLGTHTGTHIDAPAHMIAGSPTLGTIDIDTFIGRGKLVQGLTQEALDTAHIEPGDIVLFDTNTAERLYDPSYFSDYPIMPDFIIKYLITNKVKLVGLDTCSADNADGFPIHKKLLAAGIPIIENLTNLPALHRQSFQVFAVPLKLDLDGAPARVFAVVQDA